MSDGDFVTLSGTESLSNKTITSSAFNGTIGATTPSTGAFTTVTATGNITAYSDARLKSDVVTIENALDIVDRMRGVFFTKDGKRGVGVIAQEMQPVAPELVQENESGFLSVAYGNSVAYLIEAVKALRAEVRALGGE